MEGFLQGRALCDVNGDVRIMEVPFTFLDDRKKGLVYSSGYE